MIFMTWSGLSWMVPVIIFLGVLFGFMEGPRRDIYFVSGFFFSSAIIWVLGNFLNYSDVPPFIVNKANREGRGPNEHTFYYISMELWAFLPLMLVVIFLGFVLYVRLTAR